MRIFLSGNEDVCRWHLPVAQTKALSFAERCEKAGLKQNTFHFRFEETGATMQAQYAFGQLSLQIHAPFIPVEEESSKDEEVFEVGPKTFWVNTTQGYFWVEVRYDDDGLPTVILTPFEALTADGGFVYPGIGLASPGMISGAFGNSPDARYVLSQNGGVMTGADSEKGTVVSTQIIDASSRITVVESSASTHDFIIIRSHGGKEVEVRRVRVSATNGEVFVDRQYASIDMAYEGETSLYVPSMLPNPTWVHRKCGGSYFSPNKTIGYHVDIGTDDTFLGNLVSVKDADLLDAAESGIEVNFNHTPDLYRFASLLAFPVSVTDTAVEIAVISPTMGFVDNPVASRKCWGGYGMTQSMASCVDYQQDFDRWLLSPRIVVIQLHLDSGVKEFKNSDTPHEEIAADITSWDGRFSAKFIHSASYACDTRFYNNEDTEEVEPQCAWTVDCMSYCVENDEGSPGKCPKGWTAFEHWKYFSRENIKNTKHSLFLLGESGVKLSSPSEMHGFYFLFDGLWHLDIGVIWVTSQVVGNTCSLCSTPPMHQIPGENVVFYMTNTDMDAEWIFNNGSEFVTNLELVTPLGYVTTQWGSTAIGFVAKVPEEYATPHAPVLLVGGIRIKSKTVEGEYVLCQRGLMSAPCDCETHPLSLDPRSAFIRGYTNFVAISGGCPPYEWSLVNANIDGKSYILTEQYFFYPSVDEGCFSSITIKDACNQEVSMSDAYSTTETIVGDSVLDGGETSIYYHDLGEDAEYTGTLILVSILQGGALLQMPEDAEQGAKYEVSFNGPCGSRATMTVTATPCLIDVLSVDAVDASTYPQVGQWVALPGGPWPGEQCYMQCVNISSDVIVMSEVPTVLVQHLGCEYYNPIDVYTSWWPRILSDGNQYGWFVARTRHSLDNRTRVYPC